MKILSNPELEVKGFFVFLNGKVLDSKVFRYNEFNFFREAERSTRVLFSYTRIRSYSSYEYGILVISTKILPKLPFFSCHKSVNEKFMLLQGDVYAYCFDYNRNDTINIYEAHPRLFETYEANGFLTIINKGNINAILLLKLKPPVKNTDEFEKNYGPPIFYEDEEKKINYNYYIASTKPLTKTKNLLYELKEAFNSAEKT